MSKESVKDFLVGSIAIGAGILLAGTGLGFLAAPLYVYGTAKILEAISGPNDIEGIKINVLSTQAPVPIVYGRSLVGIKIVDIRNIDSTDAATPNANPGNIISGAINNHILGQVGALCVGSEDGSGIEEIEDVRFYGEFIGAISPVTAGASLTNSGTLNKYQNHVMYHAQLGTDAQTVHIDIQNQLGWSSLSKGRGIAYLALFLLFDRDVWSGRPSITALIKGNKLYDPRTSTWLYPNYGTRNGANPALVILDYLTSKRYGAGVPYAARDGGSLDFIDEQSFIDMANHCEASVSIPGGSQDRFAFNGAVNPAARISSNLADMAATCRAELVWQGGKYHLVIRQVTTSEAFELTEDNILSIEVARKGTDVPNSIQASYIETTNLSYVEQSVIWPLVGDTTLFDEDNGIENRAEVSLPFTTNQWQAIHTIMVLLREARQDVFANIVTNQEGLKLEVGNVVDVTHEAPGWVQQPMMVKQISSLPDGKTQLGLQKYDAAVYNLDTLSALPSTPTTNLPDPSTVLPPTGLTWLSDGTTALATQEGEIVPRGLLSWTASLDPFLRRYEVQFQLNVGGTWRQATPDPQKEDLSVYVLGITDGIPLDVRIRAINTIGNASVWVEVLNQAVGSLDSNRILNAYLTPIPFVDASGGGAGIDETMAPTSDTPNTSDWSSTPLWSKVTTASGVGTTVISSQSALSCPSQDSYDFEIHMADPSGTPGAGIDQGMTLHIQARMRQTADDNCGEIKVELVENVTIRATLPFTFLDTITQDPSNLYQDLSYGLTAAEVDAIGDFTDLRFRITGDIGHDNEFSDPFIEVATCRLVYAVLPQRGIRLDLNYDVTLEVDELDIVVKWDDGGGLATHAYTKTGIGGVAGVERLQGNDGDFFAREGWTQISVDITPVAQPGDNVGRLVSLKLEDVNDSPAGVRIALTAGGTARADWIEIGSNISVDLVNGRPRINASIGATGLDGLTDVTLSAPATGEVLVKQAGDWINRTLAEAGISAPGHTHAAADVVSGTFATARIPSLDTGKITTGVFSLARIPNIDVSRIPSLPASQITSGVFNVAQIPDLNASKIDPGTFPSGTWRIDGKLGIDGAPPAELASGDLLITNGILATSSAGSGNIDHLWHDDTLNEWHFVSDTTRKASGNSGLRAALTRMGNGSVTVPAHSFSGDTDLGIYRVGANVLGLAADRVEIHGTGDEMLRMSDDSATGSPYITWYQSTTRRAFIQYQDSGDNLKINTDLATGRVSLQTANIEHIRVEGVNEAAHGEFGILNAGQYWDPVLKGATNVIDWQEGNFYEYSWTGSRTISMSPTPKDGFCLVLTFNYVSGSGVLTMPAAWRWNGGIGPSAPTNGVTLWIQAIWQAAGIVTADWGLYS